MAVHAAILKHMKKKTVARLLLPFHLVEYSSIEEYIRTKNMDKASVWGTDIEILTLSHLLQTPIHLYLTERAKWGRYSPRNVDTTLNRQMSMYLWHPPAHFEVVRSIRK